MSCFGEAESGQRKLYLFQCKIYADLFFAFFRRSLLGWAVEKPVAVLLVQLDVILDPARRIVSKPWENRDIQG